MSSSSKRVIWTSAVPGVQLVPNRKGRTYHGTVYLHSQGEDIRHRKAFIKLLNNEDIVKEAICAVLASVLNIPIDQPCYVYVASSELSEKSNHDNIAFGLISNNEPAFQINNYIQELLLWDAVIPCAVFDEWIANRDRLPKNILFEGNSKFSIFDHDDAMPEYITESQPINNKLFQILIKDKSEFEKYQIREKAMQVVETIKTIDWEEVKELVNPDTDIISSADLLFDKFSDYLIKRSNNLREIISANIGLKQQELFANKKNKIKIK